MRWRGYVYYRRSIYQGRFSEGRRAREKKEKRGKRATRCDERGDAIRTTFLAKPKNPHITNPINPHLPGQKTPQFTSAIKDEILNLRDKMADTTVQNSTHTLYYKRLEDVIG